MSSLPGSLPMAPLQPLPPLREGFFQSLCPFCLFLSARVFRLVCILYMHTTHSPSRSRNTLHTGSPYPNSHLLSISLCSPFIVFLASSIFLPEIHQTNTYLTLRVFHLFQLYGEYREHLGNFARREAARLLTERQWRRQAGDSSTAAGRRGHSRWHHHHHSVTLESHPSHTSSSTKKPRPYSKCQGDQQECGVITVCSKCDAFSF